MSLTVEPSYDHEQAAAATAGLSLSECCCCGCGDVDGDGTSPVESAGASFTVVIDVSGVANGLSSNC